MHSCALAAQKETTVNSINPTVPTLLTALLVGSFLAVSVNEGTAHADNETADEDGPSLLNWYGHIRLDALLSDSRLNNLQTPQWVESEPDFEQDDAELSIHPRLTRLGVDVAPQNLGKVTASGKIEVDFQNGGGEARQALRMRHGYLELKHEIFEVLIGQTWDLASPLNPAANGDTLMWNAGNTGDRRPQIRGSVWLPAAGGALRLSAMVGQTGAVDGQNLDDPAVDNRADGLDAAAPTVQGLAELQFDKVRAGFWGHGGFTRTVTEFDGVDGFGGWAAGVHAAFPIGKRISVKGELFTGRNLSDFRGGIGQGVNTTLAKGIRTDGGWAEIGARLNEHYKILFGVFVDNPDNDDINDGDRGLNYAYSVVNQIEPYERLRIGAEYIFWKTDYKGGVPGTANRFNLHATLSF